MRRAFASVVLCLAACRPEVAPPAPDRVRLAGRAVDLDRREVSAADYERCVTAGKCRDARKDSPFCNAGRPDRANHPVNCTYLADAHAYCAFANARLPTAIEWRTAAARSPQGFPWGDAPADCARATFDSGGPGCGANSTSPVSSKPAGRSPDGFDDLAGNVWEWVEDPSGELALGGGFLSPASELGILGSRPAAPGSRSNDVGFRCARDLR